MRAPLLLLTLVLAGCQTLDRGLPADALFPAVTSDLIECAKRKGVDVPQRKLTQDEAEKFWRADRFTIVALRECFSELLARDRRLAKR